MPTTVSSSNELVSAVENAGPGSEIVVADGTYNFDGEWNITSSGESGNPLLIRAADSARPHIQFAAGKENSTSDSGIKVDGAYVTVRGFEISDSGYKGIYSSQADGCTFENLDVHDNRLWGVMNNGADDVTFRNCDSHHNNGDPENSDGFNMTGPATNGLIEGCRSWANGDDGFDMWVSQGHTIRHSMAWDNGRGSTGDGNGFKLGGGPGDGGGHTVHHCVAFNNRNRGFDSNNAGNPLEIYNCTAGGNGSNYRIGTTGDWASSYTIFNCIDFDGPMSVRQTVDAQNNTWNLGISDPQFLSTDPSSSDFLRLSSDSPCIGAGVNGGDLGAFTSDGSTGGSTGDTQGITVDGKTNLAASRASRTQADLNANHTGFTGDGYLQYIGSSGGSSVWQLDVAAEGEYTLGIRYALGASESRTARLTVDGTSQSVTFQPTGSWDSWTTMTDQVSLPSGGTELSIETTGEDAGNVDQVALEPVSDGSSDGGSTDVGTPYHGYNVPEPGASDWHVPLNENFKAIDRDVPVVDSEAVIGDYPPAKGTLYVASDTGVVYVGDGSQWNQLGALQ